MAGRSPASMMSMPNICVHVVDAARRVTGAHSHNLVEQLKHALSEGHER